MENANPYGKTTSFQRPRQRSWTPGGRPSDARLHASTEASTRARSAAKITAPRMDVDMDLVMDRVHGKAQRVSRTRSLSMDAVHG